MTVSKSDWENQLRPHGLEAARISADAEMHRDEDEKERDRRKVLDEFNHYCHELKYSIEDGKVTSKSSEGNLSRLSSMVEENIRWILANKSAEKAAIEQKSRELKEYESHFAT